MCKPFVAITSFFIGGGGGGGEGVLSYVLSRFSFTATRRADVTTNAKIMVPSLLRTHSYQKAFYFKPRVGQIIALRASPTTRIAPFFVFRLPGSFNFIFPIFFKANTTV